MDNIDMRGGFWNLLITLLEAVGSVVPVYYTHLTLPTILLV